MACRSVLCGRALLPSAIVRITHLPQEKREEVRGSYQPLVICSQELLPRGLDIKQEELGDLVDKEMAATSAAIETATARIEVWKCLKI